jgi:hypothetical protein
VCADASLSEYSVRCRTFANDCDYGGDGGGSGDDDCSARLQEASGAPAEVGPA